MGDYEEGNTMKSGHGTIAVSLKIIIAMSAPYPENQISRSAQRVNSCIVCIRVLPYP